MDSKLFMDRFKALKKFPPIEDGAFRKLEILQFGGCESLVELPKGFTSKGAFPTLRELSMSDCKVLQNFPPIEDGAFGKLETLSIAGCESLVELPKGFTSKGAFPALMELFMYRFKALQKFPPIEDGAFGKLVVLRINRCESLVELPKGFTSKGAFPALRILFFLSCTALRNFPPIEDGAFGKLEMLQIDFCKSLVELPKGFTSKGAFPALRILFFLSCTALRNFPPIEDGAFGKLEMLQIDFCKSLVELPKGFTSKGAFPALRELSMSDCKELQNFPPIEDGAFGKLEILCIEPSESLVTFPKGFTSKGAFPALKTLAMSNCKAFRNFPPIQDGAFGKLEELFIRPDFRSFVELPKGFKSKEASKTLKVVIGPMSNFEYVMERRKRVYFELWGTPL